MTLMAAPRRADELPEVSDEAEAAEFLRISKRQLANKAIAGEIGFIKEGRSRTYPKSALLAYVDAKTKQGFAGTPNIPTAPGVGAGHGRPARARRINV